jgi:diguanylate cyclase (GGDEF)-like protein
MDTPWAIKVLAALGRLLAKQARKTDIVGRWGGEEFVVVLSGANEAGARIAAERIRKAVEAMTVLDEKGQRVPAHHLHWASRALK